MSRQATIALLTVTVAGILGASAVLAARDRQSPLPVVTERLLYLRSGEAARRLALSFDGLMADVYWIRTIQHYGRDYKNRGREDRFELLQPLLDLTTSLDPNFLIAYRFGAIFLASRPPDGPGRPDQAIALLQKGLAANPSRWQLAHDVAFTHYLHTGDYAASAEWFRRAAAMPGAPTWLGPLAATTLAQGGNRTGARQMLQELRASTEAYIRRAAERVLAQLEALDRLDILQEHVRTFRARASRCPSGWQEMVAAGLIPGLPVDPSGAPLLFDASQCAFVVSPESPLVPLPLALQSK